MREQIIDISRALRAELNTQMEATPWLERRIPQSPAAPKPNPKPAPAKPAAPPPPFVQEAELLLAPVREAVTKVAPQLAHVAQIPSQARPRCLLIDTGLPADQRQFLERLAQALTARVAPARLISAAQLAQYAKPPVRLLVAFRGTLAQTQIPLIALDSAATYADKAVKLALWNQLCQALKS
jgi:hypothetical protein